jgi:phosphate transport system substrate-binding protein
MTSTPQVTPVTEPAGVITESGSTTVQPLAEKLADAFMAANAKVKVIIQGGGSSVGIRAAIDGTVDIGGSSRNLTMEEEAVLVTHVLAREGIAVIVNPANNVNDLALTQIREIFSGKITNWREVGGSDQQIHVAVREEGSGTRKVFDDIVMGQDEQIMKKAILQPANGALIQVVRGDIAAITFVSFGYVTQDVKALSIGGVAATLENAHKGNYPIVRPLLFVTKNEPVGLVKNFIDFCTGPAGSAIITGEGYISAEKF